MKGVKIKLEEDTAKVGYLKRLTRSISIEEVKTLLKSEWIKLEYASISLKKFGHWVKEI